MEKTTYSRLFLLWMITTFLYGATTFLIGFFPINNYSMGNAEQESRPHYLDDLKLMPPTQLYDQTILMLVDALRSDFPTPSVMPFSYNHSCSRLKIRVNIPTVTMPRIKSLTTGTVSNFIDIILNIGHVEKLSDSLLHHLYKRNDTAVFAGDRTWKSLFPKQFKRLTANTDSFFVNDFYEGDKNVTAVLSKELNQTDWMLLVLHYLGLDHIGHVEGTESTKIPLKLKEMDDVVRMMYETKHFHSQLLLVTGDHGMKDGGGHGGSTTGEMYVPLFVFNGNCSRKCYRSDAYNQIDVAPTLAILWSIDIPTMSIGSLIPELLFEYSLEDQLYAYYYNALHLIRKAKRKFGQEYFNSSVLNKWLQAAMSAHKQYLLTKRNHKYDNAFFFEEAKTHYLRLSRDISEQLSDSLVQFDYGLITIGLILITLVVLHTLIVFYAKNRRSFIGGKIVWLSIIAIAVAISLWCHHYEHFITITGITSFLLVLSAILSIVYLFINFANIIVGELFNTSTRLHFSLPGQTWLLLGFLVFHIVSLVSSSYIELESMTWHYLGASAVILLSAHNFCKNMSTFKTYTYHEDITDNTEITISKIAMKTFLKSHSAWLLIGGVGLLKRSHIIAYYINNENAKIWLSCYFVAGLLIFLLCLVQQNLVQTRKEFGFYALAACFIYCYRSSIGTVCSVVDTSCCANIFVNIFWIVAAVAAGFGIVSLLLRNANTYYFDYHQQSANTIAEGYFKVLLNLLLVTSVLLHKPHNVFLVTLLIYVLSICYKMCDTIEKRTYKYKYLQKCIYTIIVGNMFYFTQGNSNSFATIDLNPGYIGQTTYNPLIVGILVTLNMYSAHFIAFVYLITHILHDSNNGDIKRTHKFYNVTEHINFILYFYTLTIIVTVLYYFWLLISFRYHLFIYSVFAPKALYEYYRVVVLLVTFLLTTANLFIFGL